jgi:hypothetical protein
MSGSAIEVKQAPPPLAMMDAPPEDAAECDRIGNELWIGLALRYEQIAPMHDIVLLRNRPANHAKHEGYQLALKRFDEYLLNQFAEWGWRMLLSTEVIRMLARWEARHPELLERLGPALALKSRVFRGEKSAPLLEDIETFADDAIVELKTLLRMIRDDFRKRRGPRPRCERIAEWMKLEIETRPEDFPKLYPHVGQLHGYVANYLPARNKKAASMLESGEIRPDSFFYQWYAVSTNRSVKDVRNLISRRRTESSQK